jgi:hypothetical protein
MRTLWVVAVLLILAGCKTNKATSDSKNAYSNYQEDIQISALPQYPGFATEKRPSTGTILPKSDQSIDGELQQVSARMIEKNNSEAYYSGYTILVYSGIDREKAFKTQEDLRMYFPDMNVEMQYQQPRYLVKVGKYNFKIESQKNFTLIKPQFPTARIIQDRFQREGFVTTPEKDNVEGEN